MGKAGGHWLRSRTYSRYDARFCNACSERYLQGCQLLLDVRGGLTLLQNVSEAAQVEGWYSHQVQHDYPSALRYWLTSNISSGI